MKKLYPLLSVLFLFYVSSFSFANTPNLFLNEFLASNSSINLDPDLYNFCDWIEIYNSEDTVVNISGYYITDDLSDPFKFQLPEGLIIQPYSFLIVWADGENFNPGNYLLDPENINVTITTCHLNFKLKKGGEEIGLYEPNGNLIDSIIFNEQITDISYGRGLDETSEWFYYDIPTPGSANLSIPHNDSIRAFKPVFFPDGGFYHSTQTISLLSEDESETIRFTLDGSIPDENSQLYDAPIIIDSTTIIRAKVFNDYTLSSLANTSTYFFDETSDLPVISIGIDPEYLWDDEFGIYTTGSNGAYQHGDWGSWSGLEPSNYFQNWERPVSIEFYNSNQDYQFSFDAGIKIHGGTSRILPQKSVSLHFRDKYGNESIDYRFFNDKSIHEFETFILRNSGSDWLSRDTGTMFRDGMIQSLTSNIIDIDRQAYKPSIIFFNGQYWGIHNIRERTNSFFLKSNHNIESDNVDLLGQKYGKPFTSNGNMDQYNQLINFIESNDISLSENFSYIKSQIDINELLNYLILQIYSGNGDWPQNNYKLWKTQTGSEKWRWIIHDMDAGFGLSGDSSVHYNTLSWAFYEHPDSLLNEYGGWAKSFFYSLLNNSEYVNEFIQRFSSHLNTLYSPSRVIDIIDSLKVNIEAEMPRHISRWEYSNSMIIEVDSLSNWEDNIENIKDFAYARPNIVRQHIVDYFGLDGVAQLTISISDLDGGKVEVHDINVPEFPYTGIYFKNIPIRLRAIPNYGHEFIGWENNLNQISDSNSISLNIEEDLVLTAVFDEVNFPPILGVIGDQSINEDQSLEVIISASDINEEDVLSYGASSFSENISVTVANDTLRIDPAEDWFGIEEIFVFVTDGILSDTTSFILIVNPVNDSPSEFSLLNPIDSSSIVIHSIDLNQDNNLFISWEQSLDIDNDELNYLYILKYGTFNGEEVLFDTIVNETNFSMSYQNITNILTLIGTNIINGFWYVSAFDEIDTTISNETWNISFDASDILLSDRAFSPNYFFLHQNYPNPFNPVTTIRYNLSETSLVEIIIYDLFGNVVKNLIRSKQDFGYKTIQWDGDNDQGQLVSSGVYLYKIHAGDFVDTKKMILLK